MRLYTIIKGIVTSTKMYYKKMKALDDYWATRPEFTVTATAQSGFSNVSMSAHTIGNTFSFNISFQVTSALSTNTYPKKKICTFVLHDDDHILNHTVAPGIENSTLYGTGGLTTIAVTDLVWNATARTLSGNVWLCGVAAGALSTGTTYTSYPYGIAGRTMGEFSLSTIDTVPSLTVDFKYLHGYTWEEFVNSNYNTDNCFSISTGNYIRYTGSESEFKYFICSPIPRENNGNEYRHTVTTTDYIKSTEYIIY